MFRCRVNKNKQKSNCKKLQKKKQAVLEACKSFNNERESFYKLEKGHAKQLQAISYTRPSSGICKGRQSTVIEVSKGLETWLKETK